MRPSPRIRVNVTIFPKVEKSIHLEKTPLKLSQRLFYNSVFLLFTTSKECVWHLASTSPLISVCITRLFHMFLHTLIETSETSLYTKAIWKCFHLSTKHLWKCQLIGLGFNLMAFPHIPQKWNGQCQIFSHNEFLESVLRFLPFLRYYAPFLLIFKDICGLNF